MFCERCGTRLEDGALVCVGCGSEQSAWREPSRPAPVQVQELALEGPKCPEHLGMPLLGRCPRCSREVCVRCAPEAVSDVLTCTRCMGLTERHARAPDGASCATHGSVMATFVCARCGTFACSACRALGVGSEGLCSKCQPTIGALASRGSRLGANIIDTLVVLTPLFLGALATGVASAYEHRLKGVAAAGMAIGLVVGAMVQLIAQLTWNQSIGKRAFGIQVVNLDGTPVPIWRLLLLRNVIHLAFAQLCGLYGLIDALAIFGAEQRCLHDYLAGTTVVEKDPAA